MPTKTQLQSPSQTDAENDLGVDTKKYDELAPILSGFLCDYTVHAKLIFAYGPRDHSWFVMMAHKDNPEESIERRLDYIVSCGKLLETLHEMYREVASKSVRKILAIETTEEEPEPEPEAEADPFEGW